MLQPRLAVLSDHDPDARALLSCCIRHYGVECIEVASLLECLHVCATQRPDVVVVVIDGSYGSIRSVEVLSRHHELASTPIIVLTPGQQHVPGAWRVLPMPAEHPDVMDAVFEVLEMQAVVAG